MATKKIYFDIMQDDRFIGQVSFDQGPFIITQDEVQRKAEKRYPRIKNASNVRFAVGKRMPKAYI
jgi:hypothetical protein